MPKAKPTLDKKKNRERNGKFPLVLRVFHKGQTRDIDLEYRLSPEEKPDKDLKLYLDKLENKVAVWMIKESKKISTLNCNELRDKIKWEFIKEKPGKTLLGKFELKLHEIKAHSTLRQYSNSVNRFVEWYGSDIEVKRVKKSLVKKYVRSLEKEGLLKNTIIGRLAGIKFVTGLSLSNLKIKGGEKKKIWLNREQIRAIDTLI